MEKRFSEEFVYDDNNAVVSPIEDDYEFWRKEQETLVDPLSDDYCKYSNE